MDKWFVIVTIRPNGDKYQQEVLADNRDQALVRHFQYMRAIHGITDIEVVTCQEWCNDPKLLEAI